MTLPDATESIKTFFEGYRRSFERFDASAIAEHFAFPAHITAESGEIRLTLVADQQSWLPQLDRLLAMYRAIDATSARVLDLTITELSPRLFQAIVHWPLYNRAGRELYDFQASYTLARLGDALRITAIAHNEIRPTVFHLNGGRDFLHFHDEPSGIVADVRLTRSFVRMPVSSRSEQAEFLGRIDESLSSLDSRVRDRERRGRRRRQR